MDLKKIQSNSTKLNTKNYIIFSENSNKISSNINKKLLKLSGSADHGLNHIKSENKKCETNYRISSLNKNENIENDKEIYLDKEIVNNLRCVRDHDLIDKPLVLYRKNIFIVDPTRSNIENRIIELEFFTKKKFDELVEEIKNFIPIHFNSHLRNYTVIKKKYE